MPSTSGWSTITPHHQSVGVGRLVVALAHADGVEAVVGVQPLRGQRCRRRPPAAPSWLRAAMPRRAAPPAAAGPSPCRCRSRRTAMFCTHASVSDHGQPGVPDDRRSAAGHQVPVAVGELVPEHRGRPLLDTEQVGLDRQQLLDVPPAHRFQPRRSCSRQRRLAGAGRDGVGAAQVQRGQRLARRDAQYPGGGQRGEARPPEGTGARRGPVPRARRRTAAPRRRPRTPPRSCPHRTVGRRPARSAARRPRRPPSRPRAAARRWRPAPDPPPSRHAQPSASSEHTPYAGMPSVSASAAAVTSPTRSPVKGPGPTPGHHGGQVARARPRRPAARPRSPGRAARRAPARPR